MKAIFLLCRVLFEKAFVNTLLTVSSVMILISFGCVQDFSRSEVAATKEFVTDQIVPILLRDSSSSPKSSSSIENCDRYERATALLDSSGAPELLQWHKPVITFDATTVEFIFFVPRPRPLFELCTDNCLRANDVPITVFTYKQLPTGVESWEEHKSVMWNGISSYSSGHACDNVVF